MKRLLKNYWPLLLITLVGALLRLYRLQGSLQFLGDQGRDALVLRDMVVNFNLPFIGPITSVGGFYLGPLYYYLMAPFLWAFNFNPAGPAYATATLGVVTIPVLYWVTQRMFNRQAALWAAGLYAIGSIPVIETRGAWNPNPMPLAVLGIVYGLFAAQKNNDRRWLWLSAVSLGVALQLHYMVVFLGPFLLWQLFLLAQNKKLRRGIFEWFLIILLTMVPLLLFELKNNFLNLNGLINYLTKNEYGSFDWWQIVKALKGRSEEAIGMLLGFGRTTTLLRTTVTRVFLVILGWLWFKKPTVSLKTVALWLLLSIGAIAFYQGGIPPYYLGFIFPAVFMLAGVMLSQLKKAWLVLAFLFLILFGYYNALNLQPALAGSGNLRSVRATARLIVDDVAVNQHQDYNLVLLDDTKDYRASAFRYFVTVYGGTPLDIDAYPLTEVNYVISPYLQTEVQNQPIWEIKSMGPTKVAEVWEIEGQENVYKLVKQTND